MKSHSLILVIAFILVAAISASAFFFVQADGFIQYLDKFDPEAICIDGSPAALYVFPGEDKTSVMFEMQGGGLCPNAKHCYARSLTDLGSSKSYPPTRNDTFLHGIMSRNCTTNPQYCKFTLVYLQYCDGLLYAVNNTNPVYYQEFPLWFKGDVIRRAALQFLVYHGNVNKIERLQYSGDSAGGVSTFTHADQDIKYLLQEIPSLQVAAAMPLSGLFPSSKNVYGVPIGSFLISAVVKLANLSFDSLNQDCLADKQTFEEKIQCASPVVAFNYSKVPTFVMQSYLDLWQVLCDLTAVLSEDNTSEQCHGAALYVGTPCPAANFPSAPPGVYPLAQCNTTQMQPLIDYQNIALTELSTLGGFSRPYNGYFMSSCVTHVAAEAWQYTGYRLNGVKMGDAGYNWFNTLPPNSQLEKLYPSSSSSSKTDKNNNNNNNNNNKFGFGSNPQHSYLDCIRTMADAVNNYECNPTCVNPVDGGDDTVEVSVPEHMKNKHFWDGTTDRFF